MNNTTEQWRPVKGFEGKYEVSSFGRLKYLANGNISNGCFNNRHGYIYFNFYDKDSKKETIRAAHRIVAEAFVPNPNNYHYVNHIDEDRTNNCVWNLEWCTASQNLSAGKVPQKISINSGRNKRIAAYDMAGNFVGEFYNITEATKKTGICRSSIRKCLGGIVKNPRKGYVFKYVKKVEEGSERAHERSLDAYPEGDSFYTEKLRKENRKHYILGYDTAINDIVAWMKANQFSEVQITEFNNQFTK